MHQITGRSGGGGWGGGGRAGQGGAGGRPPASSQPVRVDCVLPARFALSADNKHLPRGFPSPTRPAARHGRTGSKGFVVRM